MLLHRSKYGSNYGEGSCQTSQLKRVHLFKIAKSDMKFTPDLEKKSCLDVTVMMATVV